MHFQWAARFGSLALLAFSALTGFALVGWFHVSAVPWTWRSMLATGCAGLAAACSALVWRAPSRTNATVSLAVVLVSLGRIGPRQEWTWASALVAGVTLVLALPVGYLMYTVRRLR